MKCIILIYNIILFFNHISAQWQTYILAYLQIEKEPIEKYNVKESLGLTQLQYGLATSTLFTFTNGFVGLMWGHLSDKYNRKWPLFFTCILWTVISTSIAATQHFPLLMTQRITFAIVMSACIPYSVSLICDYTLPKERGRAQSLFAAGMYLGVGLSSVSAILDQAVGWRKTMVLVGVICIAFGLPAIILREPPRNVTNQEELAEDYNEAAVDQDEDESDIKKGEIDEDAGVQSFLSKNTTGQLKASEEEMAGVTKQDVERDSLFFKEDQLSLWNKTKVLMSNKCFVYLTIASFWRFSAGYTLGFAGSTFFEHKYPEYTDQYAIMNTVTVVGGGLSASMLGGYLSDALEKRIPMIKGIIAGGGALLAMPFMIVTFIIQPGFWVGILSYFCAYFIGEMWYGPAHAQINNLFPSQFQGYAVAIFNLAGTLSGSIATAVASAMFEKYDAHDSNPTAAGYVLGIIVIIAYGTCGPFFLLSGREFAKELRLRKTQMRKNSFADMNREQATSIQKVARPMI